MFGLALPIIGYILGALVLTGAGAGFWGHSSGVDKGFHSRDLEVRELKAAQATAEGNLSVCTASNQTLDAKFKALEPRIKDAEDKCSLAAQRSTSIREDQAAIVASYAKRTQVAEAQVAEWKKRAQLSPNAECKDVIAVVKEIGDAAADRMREILGFGDKKAPSQPQLKVTK